MNEPSRQFPAGQAARLRALAEQLRAASSAADVDAVREALRRESELLSGATDAHCEDLVARLRRQGFAVSLDGRVTVEGAAAVVGLSPKTLSNLRHAGSGPPFVMARRRAWYPLPSLLRWRERT